MTAANIRVAAQRPGDDARTIIQLDFATPAEAHQQLDAFLAICSSAAAEDRPVFVILAGTAAECCPWPLGRSSIVTRFAHHADFMVAMESAKGHRVYVW